MYMAPSQNYRRRGGREGPSPWDGGTPRQAEGAKLADEYHELNRQIHRIETDVEPASDEHQTELRKQRMALKDELYNMLKA